MGSEGISSWTFTTAVAECILMSVHTYMYVLVHVCTGIYMYMYIQHVLHNSPSAEIGSVRECI